MTPFNVRVSNPSRGLETIAVPCGRCPACYKRRVSGWSFRLLQEEKISVSSHFITLTYDTKNVPITKNGFMQINKRDLQLFFKRLRKCNEEKIRYYAVGEYGGKTNRPHYHIILFNAKIETVQPAWNLGEIHYGKVEGASVGYCLKYMSKKSKIPMHKNDDRQPEFGLMSKGLGKNYITDQMQKWHLQDPYQRMYVNLPGNQKISMPRYYKDKIYTEQQRKQIGVAVRLKMLKQLEVSLVDPMYYRNTFESHKQAFRKMDADYSRNQKI